MAILNFDPLYTDTLNANNPKAGSTDSNGFYVQISWTGTINDETGAASLSFKNTLFSTNNNFSQWTIASNIKANNETVSSVSVQRTLAKNSEIVVNNGTVSLSGWDDTSKAYRWLTNNGGQTYYLSMTAFADGSGTASYIPNNASVGTTITVTKTGGSTPPTTYSVSFNSNGGSSNPASITNLADGASPGLFPSPGSRSGYTFTGWNGAYSVGSTIPSISGSDVTYTAQWALDGGTTYTYQYSIDGVTGTPSGGTVASGTSITLGNPGTKTGYSFGGWYTDSGFSNFAGNASASYTITQGTTFYAKWTSTASTLPVWPSPAAALPQFIAGQAYSATVVASNMSGGTYSISGSVPGGITINSATGVLSGTVTTASDYSFTVSAQNAGGSATQNYSGSITGVLRVRQGEAWVKAVAKKRDGEIWKPGTVRVWSNNTWLYGS